MKTSLQASSSTSQLVRGPEATSDITAFISLPFATVMASGDIVSANEAFRTTWPSFASLPNFLHGITKEDHEELRRSIRLACGAGKSEPRVLRLPQDRSLWMQIAFAPSPSVRGAALLLCLDMSRSMTDFEELTYRESRWDNALISSVVGVWDHNWGKGRKYYSPTWYKMRGLQLSDPLPATTEEWLQRVHPDDRLKVVDAMKRQAAGDPEFAMFDYRELHKDGHWVWIECRGAAIEWDEAGYPSRIVGTDTDVTQRKTSEDVGRRTARRLEMALDISGVGVFEADFTTCVSEWDERMFAIFGLTGNEKVEIGQLWESLVHPEDLQRVLQAVEAREADNTAFADEYRVILKDGAERIIRSYSKRFTDHDGHSKMVGANWDVTEDVLLHRELEQAKRLAENKNAELVAAHKAIEYNALHDHLTGLPNRRYLDDTLRLMGEKYPPGKSGLAVLHIDLDKFKEINDTFGHATGDYLLQHVARTLKSCSSNNDFVARVGGDEFVIVLQFSGKSRAVADLAKKITRELSRPVSRDGQVFRTGASIGIACQRGGELDPGQLLLDADVALYRAKKAGRNRHEFFSAKTKRELSDAKRISGCILLALEQRQFVPFYQLQFDAASLDVTGVETLARLITPEGGVMSPQTFLPVAEELNVVADIDSLILEAALCDFRDWRGNGLSVPKLSVNVSYRRLYDPGLMKKLRSLDIEPGTLAFELLESIFLDQCDDQTMKRLADLRQMGISLEIDDFGTGHASIVSLLKVKPSALKVDRELVKDIPDSPEQQALLRSVIDIGRSLEICVVAEGVETQRHVQILRTLGCDTLQGYALAKPMPSSELAEALLRQPWRASYS